MPTFDWHEGVVVEVDTHRSVWLRRESSAQFELQIVKAFLAQGVDGLACSDAAGTVPYVSDLQAVILNNMIFPCCRGFKSVPAYIREAWLTIYIIPNLEAIKSSVEYWETCKEEIFAYKESQCVAKTILR